jgi:hypothetical protein
VLSSPSSAVQARVSERLGGEEEAGGASWRGELSGSLAGEVGLAGLAVGAIAVGVQEVRPAISTKNSTLEETTRSMRPAVTAAEPTARG